MTAERTSGLCPNCRKLISLDEKSCPYCGLANPGSRRMRFFLSRWAGGNGDLVRIIIYTNVAFYILSLLMNPRGMGMTMNPLMLLSPSEGSLFLLGATGTLPIGHFHRWWTLITASFLHGGLLHIFFNMMALNQLGPFVVSEFGVHRFAVIYTLTGIAGFLLSFFAGIPFTIGASASICGLIGAILYFARSRGGYFGMTMYRQAMGWVVGLVIFGLLVPGINNWAHGGGLAAGVAAAFILGYEERQRETAGHRVLGKACIYGTAILLVWAVFQAFSQLLQHAAYFR
ncbi:MAG TPA: rhomboid family intramembrane serine protease [Syntrophales bacterium]|nr:rhomboid family intramembrane serine protease [Syntrophales bacterium]HOD97623.1 rhomboid family intramembrane serine protease [Syntrophales bacterium]HOH72969.1 rhomboid family intramembrane serine protease [Syntrophales bacterium]HPN09536.1 rhomboid family intramembrane serine protease [Syntrophales bacterium]HPX81471.1 rhomboid family intramembrane serine protease [Syntrophales bacterium]